MIKLKGGDTTETEKRYQKAMGLAPQEKGNKQPLKKTLGVDIPRAKISEKSQVTIKGKTEVHREREKETAADSDFDSDLDMDDDDEVMKVLRERRIKEMKEAQAEKQFHTQRGHGMYHEIKEEEFLEAVTKSKYSVVHFYHDDFERCKMMDKHLSIIARKHLTTKIIKLNAEKAQFFVKKLQIVVLPTVICFIDGVATDRIVGFEELGGRDTFTTDVLEKRIAKAKVIAIKKDDESDDEEELDYKNTVIR